MLTPTAPSNPRPVGVASSNPSGSGGGVDYLVQSARKRPSNHYSTHDALIQQESPPLSSAGDIQSESVAAGSATRAVLAVKQQQAQNDSSSLAPTVQHDIAFYEALTQELPDCPVLHSVLFSHKSVCNEFPECSEVMKEVNKTVDDWKEGERKKLAVLQSLTVDDLSNASNEFVTGLEQKEQFHLSTIRRMEELAQQLERRDHEGIDQEWDKLQAQRQIMEQRHAAQNELVRGQQGEVEKIERLRISARQEVQFHTELSKCIMRESVDRNNIFSLREREWMRFRVSIFHVEQRHSFQIEETEVRAALWNMWESSRTALDKLASKK